MDTKTLLASVVALALILLPEPVTTATGTLVGFAILAGTFSIAGGFV
jgi:hypothetical protein